MSDDIVKRVREACDGHPHAKIEWPHRILHEAADEIERLRTALEKIAGLREYDPQDYKVAATYKPQDGMWTVDEHLADAALQAPSEG